jgi:peptide/nickel transport system substrate-binding protein
MTVFRYNEPSGITSLDPAYSKDLANIWPCNQLYNGLVELDEALIPVPSLAKRWDISEDGCVYTFYLRDDILFHDHHLFPQGKGRHVRAGDVVYSFNRILDPKVASPGAWVFSNIEWINGSPAFYALDDTTLQIHLEKPFPPFLGILCMKYCSVVPKEVVEHYGTDFRKNPVGTGPFRFKLWSEGIKLVMVRNENYFEFEGDTQLPYLDAVAINFKIDKQSAFLEFVKGNLDFLSGLDPAYKDEVLTRDGKLKKKYTSEFYMLTCPYLNTEYLGIMVDSSLEVTKGSPFQSKKVRQAMSWGVDRVKLVKYLRNNLVTPGNYGILPPGLRAFDTTGYKYSYDPDRSRQLLDLAGFPMGKGLPPMSLYTTSDYLDIFKFLQYQYAEIGIHVNIEVTPYATLKELKAQSKVNFFRASWIADYPDEENYLALFCSWNFAPSGPNYTHFSHPEYDRLYQLSVQTMEDSLRLDCYRQMNNIIMEEAPVIILYYDQVVRLISKRVKDLGINSLNMLDLRNVKIEETTGEL